MATTVTETIGAAGDYTTIAAWESATDNDLVTADEIRVGQLIDTSFYAGNVTMSGATTDSTRYRVLEAGSGNAFDPTDNSGAKISTTAANVLRIQESYFNVIAVLCQNNDTSTSNRNCIRVLNSGVTEVNLERCVLKMRDGTGNNRGVRFQSTASGPNRAKNCLAIGGGVSTAGLRYGFAVEQTGDTLRNCAAYDIQQSGNGIGIDASVTLSEVVKNCIAMDCDTDYNGIGSTSGVASHNVDSDGSLPSGQNNERNKVLADIWEDAANDDFHLAGPPADNDAVNNGTTANTTDIDGIPHNNDGLGYDRGPYNRDTAVDLDGAAIDVDVELSGDLGVDRALAGGTVDVDTLLSADLRRERNLEAGAIDADVLLSADLGVDRALAGGSIDVDVLLSASDLGRDRGLSGGAIDVDVLLSAILNRFAALPGGSIDVDVLLSGILEADDGSGVVVGPGPFSSAVQAASALLAALDSGNAGLSALCSGGARVVELDSAGASAAALGAAGAQLEETDSGGAS